MMRGNRSFGRSEDRPVTEGQELDVKIESLGSKGDGIAKVGNFVVIVPGVKEGQTVRVKVTRVLKKMAFAEVVGEGSGDAGQDEENAEDANCDDESGVCKPEDMPDEESVDDSEDSENF
jgi:predicted RNA-binding protein with TRAM domain